VVALVLFVAIKTPDTTDDDETTNPVVPEIAEIMKAEIGPCEVALKTDVVENDVLR